MGFTPVYWKKIHPVKQKKVSQGRLGKQDFMSKSVSAVTLESCSNMFIGRDMDLLRNAVDRILAGDQRLSAVPDLWDGRTCQRIAKVLATPQAHLPILRIA